MSTTRSSQDYAYQNFDILSEKNGRGIPFIHLDITETWKKITDVTPLEGDVIFMFSDYICNQ